MNRVLIRVRDKSVFFSSFKHLDRLTGLSSLYSLHARVLSMGAKQPGRDVGHSPQSSAKV